MLHTNLTFIEQQTSDGKVKILQRFDCSGCGDVHTTAVTPQDGYITGLTGRKLLIPADWQNPTDKFRVGVKNAFDLYPQKVKERIKAYYKEKKWDEGHRKATAEATREMSLFQNKLTNGQLSYLSFGFRYIAFHYSAISK